MDATIVGRRIRSWMVDAGMNATDLATELGVSTGTLKSWIYGTRTMTFERAYQIAEFFGKSLDDLAVREKTLEERR